MTGLLGRHRRVAADTNVFIYHLEGNPEFGLAVAPLFEAVERRRVHLLTSAVTMLELLVKPLRLDAHHLAAEIFAGLTTLPSLEFVPVDVALAARAADLRARHRLSVPDAIQLASAVVGGASAFVCNDERLATAAGAETAMEVLRATDLRAYRR